MKSDHLISIGVLILVAFMLQLYLYTSIGERVDTSPRDLSIFTLTGPFKGDFRVVNALNSWKSLIPEYNIHVFTTNKDSCERFRELFKDINCYLDIECVDMETGKTRMGCIWMKGVESVHTEYAAFVNTDIILFNDFIETFRLVGHLGNIVLVGERLGLNVTSETKVSPSLQVDARETGVSCGEWCLDYFVFRALDFERTIVFPEFFLAGVWRWDNWLLSELIKLPSTLVIDCSQSITALHQDISEYILQENREFADVVDKQTREYSGMQYRLGNSHQAELVMECSLGSCYAVENTRRNMELLTLFRAASTDKNVALLTLSSGYLELASNFFCWASIAKFDSFVVLAEDKASAEFCYQRDIPVIPLDNEESGGEVEYGSVGFQDLMKIRTDFVSTILKYGLNVLVIDLDIVLFESPWLGFGLEDVQGQQHGLFGEISGGYIYMKSNSRTIDFWKLVKRCQDDNLKVLQSPKAREPGFIQDFYNEQACVNSIGMAWEAAGLLSRRVLPEALYPEGDVFFNYQLSQKQGYWPKIIHNNYIVGTQAKIDRFKDWGLWLPDSELRCPVHTGTSVSPKDQFHLIIRVLTYRRQESLQRLMNSLKSAHYPNGERVTLIVSIDRPVEYFKGEELIQREQLLKYATNFQWDHGDYKVEVFKEHRGLLGQWTNAWNPSSDSEVLLILEDDTEVSPHWYTWTKDAISMYYIDPAQRDSRMFGISLQKQTTILGESESKRYGDIEIEDYVSNSLYKYQLIGTWGTLFFPSHYNQFKQWLDTDAPETPCIPNNLGNAWWMRSNGTGDWEQWFIRFAFEKGYYSLYTNFAEGESLVINWLEAGLNFDGSDVVSSNPLVKTLTPDMMVFPKSESLPLYDFSFYQVLGSPDVLSYYPRVFPAAGTFPYADNTFLSQNCWIQKDCRRMAAEFRHLQQPMKCMENHYTRYVKAESAKLIPARGKSLISLIPYNLKQTARGTLAPAKATPSDFSISSPDGLLMASGSQDNGGIKFSLSYGELSILKNARLSHSGHLGYGDRQYTVGEVKTHSKTRTPLGVNLPPAGSEYNSIILDDNNGTQIQLVLHNGALSLRYIFVNSVSGVAIRLGFPSDPLLKSDIVFVTQNGVRTESLSKRIETVPSSIRSPALFKSSESVIMLTESCIRGFNPAIIDSGGNRISMSSKSTMQVVSGPLFTIQVGLNENDMINHDFYPQSLCEPISSDLFPWITPGSIISDVTLSTEGISEIVKHSLSKYVLFNSVWYDSNLGPLFPLKAPHSKPLNFKTSLAELIEYDMGLFVSIPDLVHANFSTFKSLATMGVVGIKLTQYDLTRTEVDQICQAALQAELMVISPPKFRPLGLQSEYPNLISWNTYPKPMATTDVVTMAYLGDGSDVGIGFVWPELAKHGRGIVFQTSLSIVFPSAFPLLHDGNHPWEVATRMKSGGITELWKMFPQQWTDSIIIDGSISSFFNVARRSFDGTWYIAIISATEIDRTVSFNFLEPNLKYNATFYSEGSSDLTILNHNTVPLVESYSIMVTSESTVHASLLPGNGFIAVLTLPKLFFECPVRRLPFLESFSK